MDLPRREVLRLTALGTVGAAGCATDRDSIRGVERSRETDASTSTPGAGGATDEPTARAEEPTEHPLPNPEDHCSADPAVDADDPLAVEVDARQRLRCRGRPLDTFESLEEWEVVAGSLSADEDRVFAGSQSARLAVEPGEDRARVTRRFPGGLDLSGYDLSLAVNLEAPANQGIFVRLAAPDGDNKLLLRRQLWTAGWTRVDLGPWREVGSPDLSSVTEITVQAYTGGGTTARFNVDSLRLHPRSDGGRVVVTFDDAYRSQYDVAFPIMEEYGFRGVVSVAPESTDSEGKIRAPELRELQSAGWDVVSAPRMPDGARALSADRQAARIREAKQWLVDSGFERGADVLVWPLGQYDRTSLEAASRYHHVGLAGGRSPAGAVTDPLVVPRFRGADIETVRQALDFAAKYDQLVVLSYGPIGNMRNGISDVRFEQALSYVDQRGLEVVTATDLWRSLSD